MGGAGGAGGTVQICAGTAVACGTYTTDATCSDQDGCFSNGVCDAIGGAGGAGGSTGTCSMYTDETTCENNNCEWTWPCEPTLPCSAFNNSTQCNLQQGCTWDTTNLVCNELATGGCIDVFDATTCSNVVGCTWDASSYACGGTATDCSMMSLADCPSQDGCSVQ